MSTNTENNFRNAFKSFGARGGVAATDNATSGPGGAFGQASNWFSGVRTQVSGYVPVSLGGSGGAPQEEDWLGLSWFQVKKREQRIISWGDHVLQGSKEKRSKDEVEN